MCINPIWLKSKNMFVPCGKCIECNINKSSQWAVRCALEASLYENNILVTLTYNEENLPLDKKISKRDLQLFLKRLRIRLCRKYGDDYRIRYFACGEYGGRYNRPHYHIIIFNYKPEDLFFFKRDRRGNDIYLSDEVFSCWKKGFISIIPEVNERNSRYVAKYLQKKANGSFLLMSRNGALGYKAFKHKWLETAKIYINGHTARIPRIFNDKAEKEDDLNLIYIRSSKMKRIQNYFNYCESLILNDRRYWLLNFQTSVKYYVPDESIKDLMVQDRLNKLKRIFGENFVKNFDLGLDNG